MNKDRQTSYKKRWETRRIRYGLNGRGKIGESLKYKFTPKHGHWRKQIEPDPVELQCPRCLSAFKKTKNRQVYCSVKCQKSIPGTTYGRVCACGKRFVTRRQRHLSCSEKCHKGTPGYKLAAYMRSRIGNLLRRAKTRKNDRLIALLGCTKEQLRLWLQSQFKTGMSWANYGKWHVDHVLPCASFDLTDAQQQKRCFHYTNLRPLWAVDNFAKGAKVPLQFPLALGLTCQFPMPDSIGRVTMPESYQVGGVVKVMRCEASNSAA